MGSDSERSLVNENDRHEINNNNVASTIKDAHTETTNDIFNVYIGANVNWSHDNDQTKAFDGTNTRFGDNHYEKILQMTKTR